MNQDVLRGFSERTLVSLLRTALYAGAAALVALRGPEADAVLDAVVLGAVLADYITWLVRSLMELPEHVFHGGYDAAVNLLFACFFFRFTQFQITDDGSAVAGAFMAFMLVLGVKAGYYGLQSVQRNMTQD